MKGLVTETSVGGGPTKDDGGLRDWQQQRAGEPFHPVADGMKEGTGDQNLARAAAGKVGGHPTGVVPVEEHSLCSRRSKARSSWENSYPHPVSLPPSDLPLVFPGSNATRN